MRARLRGGCNYSWSPNLSVGRVKGLFRQSEMQRRVSTVAPAVGPAKTPDLTFVRVRLACGRFVCPRWDYKNEKCPKLSYNHNCVEMRQFTTSVTRSMLMSIRFKPKNAYSGKPEVEEEVRRDVARDIVSKGYGDIAGHAEIS